MHLLTQTEIKSCSFTKKTPFIPVITPLKSVYTWFCDPVMCIQPISIPITKTFVKSYFPHLLWIHYICLRTLLNDWQLTYAEKGKADLYLNSLNSFHMTIWTVLWPQLIRPITRHKSRHIDDVITMQSQISFLILNNCFLQSISLT